MDGKYDSKSLANDTCICTVLYLLHFKLMFWLKLYRSFYLQSLLLPLSFGFLLTSNTVISMKSFLQIAKTHRGSALCHKEGYCVWNVCWATNFMAWIHIETFTKTQSMADYIKSNNDLFYRSLKKSFNTFLQLQQRVKLLRCRDAWRVGNIVVSIFSTCCRLSFAGCIALICEKI